MWNIFNTIRDRAISSYSRNIVAGIIGWFVGHKLLNDTEAAQLFSVLSVALANATVATVEHYTNSKKQIAQVYVAQLSNPTRPFEEIKAEAKVIAKMEDKIEDIIKEGKELEKLK